MVAHDNVGIIMTQTSVKHAEPSHKNWQMERFTLPTFSLVPKTAHTKPVTSDLCTIQSNSYQQTLFPQHLMPPTFSPQFLNSSHKAFHIWSVYNSIPFLSMKPISSKSISLAGFLSFATQTPNQLIKLAPWSRGLLQAQMVNQMNNKLPTNYRTSKF